MLLIKTVFFAPPMRNLQDSLGVKPKHTYTFSTAVYTNSEKKKSSRKHPKLQGFPNFLNINIFDSRSLKNTT